MRNEFNNQIEYLVEKHLPVAFLDYNSLQQAKNILIHRDRIGRKEILILSYLIGATIEESNNLLYSAGYSPLYAKRREDAIWLFALSHQLDCASIFSEIFPQNVDASIEKT